MPVVPHGCDHPAHIFHLLLPSLAARSAFIEHMKQRRILAMFHYQPLHLSDMGRALGGRPGQCPITEDIADRLVRLPLFYQLTDAEQSRVVAAVQEFQP
jgi:dTDP-4-amino-4,6-dideoxygalactose transaminase